MTEEPSNAAAEWLRWALDLTNQLESATGEYGLTDDFYAEDHRRTRLFERASRDEFVAVNDQMWSVGSGRPHFTVEGIVAVRGDRLAAAKVFFDLADGMGLDAIYCLELDSSLQSQRRVGFFDPEDRDAAVSLLERWETELDD